MRRIASYLLSVIITLSGITALAAEPETVVKDVYNHSENSVSASEAGVTDTYSTVMIKTVPKYGENAEVVYINQESGGFSAVTTFLMKKDCADGNYIATFGNENGDKKTINFFKGEVTLKGTNISVVLNTAQKMTVADFAEQTYKEASDAELGTFKKGFTLLVNSTDAYNTAYLVSSDGQTCYGYFTLPTPYTTVTGYASIAYGLQLFNIPEEKKDLNLYLGGAPKR